MNLLHASRGVRIFAQLLLLVALVLCFLPLALIVQTSVQGQGILNYWIIVSTTPFPRFIFNSLLIAVVTVSVVAALALAAAFGLEYLRPRGSVFLKLLILGGLTMPVIALVVPLFALFDELRLINTYWAVIVPMIAVSLPFGFLLTSNYIRGLPVEIFEAAKLDGAGTWRFFISILLPISRPILFVVAIFTFLGAWNEYTLPLLFLQDADLKAVTQVPSYFQSEHLIDLPKVFAASVLISLPVVLLYIALQSSFRRGLAGGSIK
jgi:raffinose/stachyose/melibiose transport system permease protein